MAFANQFDKTLEPDYADLFNIEIEISHDLRLLKKENIDIYKITVHTKDMFIIRLRTWLGTGYQWELASGPKKNIKLLGLPLIESPPNLKPGGSELQVFHFQAMSRGFEKISFDYVRPWQRANAQKKTLQLYITIE